MIVIELPIPPRCLSPNGRAHWRVKHAAAKGQKEHAWALAKGHPELPATPWKAAHVHVAFYDKQKCGRDEDNARASLKYALDGIAAAGVVENDKDFRTGQTKMLIDKDNPRVEIGVEEVK